MKNINFKPAALHELNEYAKESDYTLAEILYSFLRYKISGKSTTNEIKTLTDEEIYSLIEQVREEEKEYTSQE